MVSPLLEILSFLSSLIQFWMIQNISPTLYDAFCTIEQWNGYDVGRKWFWSKSTGQALLLSKHHNLFYLGIKRCSHWIWVFKESIHQSVAIYINPTQQSGNIITQMDCWWSCSLKYFLVANSRRCPKKRQWQCPQGQPRICKWHGKSNINSLRRNLSKPHRIWFTESGWTRYL